MHIKSAVISMQAAGWCSDFWISTRYTYFCLVWSMKTVASKIQKPRTFVGSKLENKVFLLVELNTSSIFACRFYCLPGHVSLKHVKT